MAPTPNDDEPFRFYDNRQTYLMFVTTCGEKWAVVERIDKELERLNPKPPALRIFDAGIGDGTVLSGVLRRLHRRYPTVPFVVVAKEISLEDVRLALDKMPDRLVEHPDTVLVFTNLYYFEAPYLEPADDSRKADVARVDVRLTGDSSSDFEQQLKGLNSQIADLWKVDPSPKTGNPRYVTPAVLTVSRADRAFPLAGVRPEPGRHLEYDLVLAVQPYRARLAAEKKIQYVLGPLAETLAECGVLVGVQSTGQDPGMEIIRAIWPDEAPFQSPGPTLMRLLLKRLAETRPDARYADRTGTDEDGLFRYHMHSMPSEIAANIGTSTLFAAWNAAVYVAQVDHARLNEAMSGTDYFDITKKVLERYGGLWFTDETFTLQRLPPRQG
jgi:hypothetical protein